MKEHHKPAKTNNKLLPTSSCDIRFGYWLACRIRDMVIQICHSISIELSRPSCNVIGTEVANVWSLFQLCYMTSAAEIKLIR